KTSLILSVLTGLNALMRLGLSQKRLQTLSGRGGASGVGVHAFFEGGIIWDAGHPAEPRSKYVPSSVPGTRAIPPLLARLRFPERWRVALMLPAGSGVAGKEERAF